MTIGLSLDLAVFAIGIAVIYWLSKEGSWEKMLAKYMWLIVAIAVVIQMTIDYTTDANYIVGLVLFFIAVFIVSLVIDLFAIVQTVVKPFLHKRFR